MRRYLIFAAAGLSLFMYSIDSTAVAVAFPHFISEFDTNVLWAAWTLSIYIVAVTSMMPLPGNLSDSFGRKPVFLGSLLLFTLSSLACGLAPNIYSPGGLPVLSRGGGRQLPAHGSRHRERSVPGAPASKPSASFPASSPSEGSSGPTWAAGL